MTRIAPLGIALGLALTVPTRAHAEEKIVYMVESEDKKSSQIFLAGPRGETPERVAEGIYPDVSADGQHVAYIEVSGRDMYLVSKNVASGHIEQWTPTAGFYLQPDFSGDGRFLVVSGPYGPAGGGPGGRRSQIAVFDLAAERARGPKTGPAGARPKNRTVYDTKPAVIATPDAAYFPEISSTGRWVVFHQSRGRPDKGSKKAKNKWITLHDREARGAGAFTDLTGPDEYCFEPALSLDDRYVAFICRVAPAGKGGKRGEPNDDIYLIDLRDRAAGRVRVTRAPGKDWAPTFRPDGDLVFASDRDGGMNLYQATRRGKRSKTFRVRPLIRGPGTHYVPAFSGAPRR